MATDTINYKVQLDTSEIATKLYETRSMVSGTLGGPSNFAGAVGGIGAFGTDVSAAYGMMRGGLQQGMGAIQTYTDPGMAYQMHYGMIQAQSTLGAELNAYRNGAAGVAFSTPPGVGAGDYAQLLAQNLGDRVTDAGVGFMRGALPLAASFPAWSIGSKAASLAGLGGLASMGVGFGVSAIAEHVLSKGIEEGDKIFGEVNELGNIATAGRGFSMAQTHQFGRGFRDMASRMGITTNELGDIVSGIRANNMMPSTHDVQASLSQFESMAKDIRDIAVGMQTSLGRATQYLKSVENLGMGRGAGGVFAAAGMAESLGTSLGGLTGYVGAGMNLGRQAQIGGGFGAGLFLQSAFAGARGAADLTGEERLMAGGSLGLGRAFSMHALQNAMGPYGQMQMMAMMGPSGAMGLPGGAMATLEQAAGNIFGGGDPIANFIEFSTNSNRMMNQMGAKGVRLMQAHAIQDQAQFIMQLSPGTNEQRALQMAAQTSGLNQIQARAMAGFIMRGFKDPGPNVRVEAMPGVFGGERVASMAIRAATDTTARGIAAEAAESSKWPWERAYSWIGEKWANMRMEMQEHAEETARDRMASVGVFTTSQDADRAIASSMRTGGGILANAELDISKYGSAGYQMQNVLSFAGAHAGGGTGIATGMGTYGVSEIRKSVGQLARNIYHSSRLSASEQHEVNNAGMHISMAINKGDLKASEIAEHIDANINKVTKGGGEAKQALGWLKGNVRSVIEKTGHKGWLEEYDKSGLGGAHGAQMISTINRFMRSSGRGTFDLGRTLGQEAASGIGAARHAVDMIPGNLAREALGRPSAPTEGEIASEVAVIRANRMRNLYEQTAGVPRSVAEWKELVGTEGADTITEKERQTALARLDQKRANAVNNNQAVMGMAKEVLSEKPMLDYIKTRDALYYKPFRDARAELEKQPGFKSKSKEEQSAAIAARGKELKAEAEKRFGPEILKKKEDAMVAKLNSEIRPNHAKIGQQIIRNMEADPQGKGVMKQLAQKAELVSAKQISNDKKSEHKKNTGRTVAFQNQAESFQGQITQALRKSTLALQQVQETMKAMEGRLKGPKGA